MGGERNGKRSRKVKNLPQHHRSTEESGTAPGAFSPTGLLPGFEWLHGIIRLEDTQALQLKDLGSNPVYAM